MAAGTVVSGRGIVAFVRRHMLASFFVLAFAFSWSYWIPAVLAGGTASHFPGLLGPMLAAFVVTAIGQGRAGTRDLLARMGRWRVRARWYLVAVVPALLGLVGLVVLAAGGDGFPSLDELSTMPGLPSTSWAATLVLVLIINGYGEEVGWRGLAWPRLRDRHSLRVSALILTGFWALWHVPAFWLDTGLRDLDPWVIPGWIVGLAAGAVVLGWLYEHARSSLLIVVTFHTLLNMASATEGTEGVPAIVVSIGVIVFAVAILRSQSGGGPRPITDAGGPVREGSARLPRLGT